MQPLFLDRSRAATGPASPAAFAFVRLLTVLPLTPGGLGITELAPASPGGTHRRLSAAAGTPSMQRDTTLEAQVSREKAAAGSCRKADTPNRSLYEFLII